MTTPMKCPTCGENNDGKMQFCIFCGTTIVPPQQVKQDDAIHQSSIVTVPSFPAVSNSLICSVCHRTDPLHGQYCVFCGGRTASHAQVDSSSHIPAMVPMRADNRGGSQNLSGEYQFAHSNTAVRKAASSGGGMVAMVLAIVLGVVLGGGTGFGVVYAFKGSLEPSILEKQWPGDGLVVYTALPGTNVMVENHDEKSLYAGITGKTGALAIDSIHPGAYRVSVLDGTRSVRKNVVVNAGSVAVVGYPDPVK